MNFPNPQTAAILRELSHDLRTPITSSSVTLEMLDTAYDSLDEKDRRRFVAIAASQVRYLGQLINELHCLSESAVDPGPREAIDLAALLGNEMAARRLLSPSLTWEACIPSDGQVFHGCRSSIVRMIRNALDNASRFAASTVRVSLCTEGDGTRLVVLDDGEGASAEAVRAFGEGAPPVLERGAFSSMRSLGIGSAIMKRAADAHGGSVSLSNWETEDGRVGGAQVIFEFR